jgi:hypothetical protein
MMSVDPVDDCTFWYTQEYFDSTSDRGWKTRIGSFRFPACGPQPNYYYLHLPVIFKNYGASLVNIIQDGSFEVGTPSSNWSEESTNYGTPLCDAGCGNGGGTANPRTGSWWGWFGGIEELENGALSQTLTIPTGTATLKFWLWIWSSRGSVSDTFRVLMDGTPIFSVNATTPGYSSYTEVSLNVSAYANGGSHTLRFENSCPEGLGLGWTNFNLDDVSLWVASP